MCPGPFGGGEGQHRLRAAQRVEERPGSRREGVALRMGDEGGTDDPLGVPLEGESLGGWIG